MFSIPSWFLVAALAGLASNTFAFFNRYLLKGNDDATAYAWFTETVRFIVFALIAIFNWHLIVNPYSISLLLLIGITEWAAGYWYMKMHEHSQLSISSIISRMRLIWVPIIGFFLIHEKLLLSEYLGIAVLFFGLSIVVAPRKFFIDKGAVYANLSSFVIALNIIFMKMALPYASNVIINAAMSFPSVFLFPIFMKNPLKRIREMLKINLFLKFVAIGFNIISLYLAVIALQLGDASKVMAVYQGTIIFAVLGGIIFLKERQNIVRKLIGTFVTIIGIFLLSST